MQKDLNSINKVAGVGINELTLDPDNLLKNSLKTNGTQNNNTSTEEHNSTTCNCIYCREAGLKLDKLESEAGINNLSELSLLSETSSTTTPENNNTSTDTPPPISQNSASDEKTPPIDDGITKKMATLKSDRETFNKSETPDLNILNKYLPYRNSIANDAEKLKKYDALIDKMLKKIKLQIAGESFGKDTKLSDLTKLKPVDNFLSRIAVGSIAEVYHNREDLIDKVLDRPEGFEMVLLQREKDSGVVGLYDTKSNYILADGAAVMMGILNLSDTNGKPDELNVLGHEFTHAVDTSDSITLTTNGSTTPLKESTSDVDKSGYHADGFLPNMSDEDKKIIEAALNEIKTNGDGVEKYAQANIQEFIAVTLGETFIDDPAVLKNGPPALKALYDMYSNYLKFDPASEKKAIA